MNKAELYLATEFLRYYPEADVQVHTDEVAETIQVTLLTDFAPNTPWVFTMEIGSDDDYFRFIDGRGTVITIPFSETNDA